MTITQLRSEHRSWGRAAKHFKTVYEKQQGVAFICHWIEKAFFKGVIDADTYGSMRAKVMKKARQLHTYAFTPLWQCNKRGHEARANFCLKQQAVVMKEIIRLKGGSR